MAGSATMHLEHRRLLAAAHTREAVNVEETALRLLQLSTRGEEDERRLRGAAASKAAALAAEARVLIAGTFAERVTLDTLARTLGVSPFRLCRAFRQATGTCTSTHQLAAGDRIERC
jgi:AraC-like DNA-binding protein